MFGNVSAHLLVWHEARVPKSIQIGKEATSPPPPHISVPPPHTPLLSPHPPRKLTKADSPATHSHSPSNTLLDPLDPSRVILEVLGIALERFRRL